MPSISPSPLGSPKPRSTVKEFHVGTLPKAVHENDGLIQAAKELGVAYVAYSPLGHGWLVDEFSYNTPDDFAPDDFRRKSK